MNETVTLQTLLIAVAPFGLLLLSTLFASVLSGSFDAAGRRLRGHPSRVAELERRVATLETALKRARASELPLEIEAERLAEEIQQMQSRRRDVRTEPPGPGTDLTSMGTTHDAEPRAALEDPPPVLDELIQDDAPADAPTAEPPDQTSEQGQAAAETPVETPIGAEIADATEPADPVAVPVPIIDLPADPDETEEDRLAREQLEAEERERIEQLAAEEARIRHEREEAERRTRERQEAEARRRLEEQQERERIEREKREEEERIERARLEAEAERKREEERIERERQEAEARKRLEEEQRRKAEEFRRRVADATPKIVMSAGGSNREGATINVAVTNNITPKRAEIAVLSTNWAATPTAATFETQRKDGLFEEHWPKQSRTEAAPPWGTYQDAAGRAFECPEDAPTDDQAWIVISYERTAGGPAATWQRFEVSGAGALWYIRQPIGDPIVIEASRDEASEAAA